MKGGAREGAGRPRGAVSQRSADAVANALAGGVSPVEFMLALMRDDTADPKDRAWGAEKAAPYVHPRPAPAPRTVAIALPNTSTAQGMTDALAAILQATGRGELAPSEAQSIASVIEGQRKAIETSELLARIEALEERQRSR